jgi:IS5 family transposase
MPLGTIRARIKFKVLFMADCYANPPYSVQKTRYRGLEKNASQVNLLVGLANLYLLRRQLMAA